MEEGRERGIRRRGENILNNPSSFGLLLEWSQLPDLGQARSKPEAKNSPLALMWVAEA